MFKEIKMLPLPKGWEVLVWEQKKLRDLWEKLQKDPWFFEDLGGNQQVMMGQFMDLTTIPLVGKEGFILFTGILPGKKATMKFKFWDGTVKGKEELLKELILWLFLTFKIERLEYYTLPFKRGEIRILETKLGFTYEGTLRKVFRKKDKRFNLKLFSILKDELIEK